MNTEKFDAIFFDLGGTLRLLVEDEAFQLEAMRSITRLLNTDADPKAFCALLDQRYEGYRKWAFAEMKEAPETELWTRWLAPDFPKDRVAAAAVELTVHYRNAKGRRVVAEHGAEVIRELYRRGYTLGIISNLITSKEIPDWLMADGLTPYFKSVLLSAVCGIRKPDPAIHIMAAKEAGAPPERCVYVGDNLKRDVAGTKAAGFGAFLLFVEPGKTLKPAPEGAEPDAVLYDFAELLAMFPPRRAQAAI